MVSRSRTHARRSLPLASFLISLMQAFGALDRLLD
jgi:hypothetical protein